MLNFHIRSSANPVSLTKYPKSSSFSSIFSYQIQSPLAVILIACNIAGVAYDDSGIFVPKYVSVSVKLDGGGTQTQEAGSRKQLPPNVMLQVTSKAHLILT